MTGNRFQIRSKDGKLVYAGTMRLGASAQRATLDFAHRQGELKGKAWKVIYTLDGNTLTNCDNAPDQKKPWPTTFEGKGGYLLISLQRDRP